MSTHLCLDFGTGFSKAAVCSAGRPPWPLAVGSAVQHRVYDRHMVPTALYISRDARVTFGVAALDAAGLERELPFDQLKETLTSAAPAGELDGILPARNNPRGGVSTRQAVTLYLAFLTEAALRSEHAPGRHVARSIAMPVFPEPNAQRVAAALCASLGDAHVLADHFGDALFEGIRLQDAILAFNSNLPAAPPVLAQPATIVEPVAAAAAQVLHVTPEGAGAPGMMLVIDVGAGTTDVAMFAKGQVDGAVALRHVAGSKRSIPKAGRAIDRALIAYMVRESQTNGSSDSRRLEAVLSRVGGRIKEELFLQGSVDHENVTVSLADFLASDELRCTVVRPIERGFQEMLETVDPSFYKRTIAVRRSGGGATLPFLNSLVRDWWLGEDGGYRTNARLVSAASEPQWLDMPGYEKLQSQLRGRFHRLAVALGGAYYGAEAHSWLQLDRDISTLA